MNCWNDIIRQYCELLAAIGIFFLIFLQVSWQLASLDTLKAKIVRGIDEIITC